MTDCVQKFTRQLKCSLAGLTWFVARCLMSSTLKQIALNSLFRVFILSATNTNNTEHPCSFHSDSTDPNKEMNGSLQTAVKLHWLCVPSLSLRLSMSPDFMSYMLCFQFDLNFSSCSHIMFSSIVAIVLQRQSGKVPVIGHTVNFEVMGFTEHWTNNFQLQDRQHICF